MSIDDFESGNLPRGPSVPEQVVVYLYTHREQAFTRSEIATAIEEDPNTVGTALSRLKDRGLVRHRGEYWAITDDDGGIDADEWDAVAPDRPHPSDRDADEDES